MGASGYVVLGPLPIEGPLGRRRGVATRFAEHSSDVAGPSVGVLAHYTVYSFIVSPVPLDIRRTAFPVSY